MFWCVYWLRRLFPWTGAYDPERGVYFKKSEASQYCSSDRRDGCANGTVSCHGISKGVYIGKRINPHKASHFPIW